MDSKHKHLAPWIARIGGLAPVALSTVAMAQVAPSPNTSKLIAAAGGNPQWESTAAYIGALCPNLTPGTDLRLRCAAALSAAATSPASANMALDAITPEQILAQGGVVDGTISSATAAVAGRLSALSHIHIGGPVAAGYQPVLLATNGDTAGLGGLNASRLQGYVNIVGGTGKKDDNSIETGYGYNQESISGGVDFRFSDRFTGGVSVSYGDTRLKFASNTGRMTADTWMGAVYGLWSLTDRIEVTGLVGFGDIDFSSDRHMDYAESATSTIDRIAHGKSTAQQWEGTLTVAYAMDAPRGWSYGPSLSVSGTTLHMDAFDETGAQGLDLSYQKQSTDSLQFIVGFDISKAISTQFGVISPYARVQSIYESLDDKRNVDIRYVADTTGFFPGIRLTTTAPDRSRFLLGGGIAGQFTRGWSSFADAETIVGLRDTSGYTFTLGVRREF
jgi:uncharacterized protein YhjY with autotransporter beta-barrel domain